MGRKSFVFALLIVATILCEPLIHQHPFTGASSSPCAVCSSTVAAAPVLTVENRPLVFVANATVPHLEVVVTATRTPLASRAPPAA